jgi:hypothetical protein
MSEIYKDEITADNEVSERQKLWFGGIVSKLKLQRWRLNHLYDIVDDKGKVLRFKMRMAQKLLYLGMHYLNIILKSRQHGITTFICLFFLDTCLFNSNTHACIIAHNKDDAKDFFTKKILFAYNNLHPLIRKNITAERASTSELVFSNGSSIRVTTSGRSGTYQLVHVSEFGKICAKYPHKAEEIVTGTLNAVHPGQLVFIESTAEGREGKFYDMTDSAMKDQAAKLHLTKLDWKFFFFGWFDNPLNQLDKIEAKRVIITDRMKKYFEKVETALRRLIPIEYKAWYIKKERDQGELMLREHPSTPAEAFLQSIKGVYYAKQMLWLRKRDRMCKVPFTPHYPVDTWWDIGFNDTNSIWFVQTIGQMIHVINYYEDYNEGLGFYAELLREYTVKYKYNYGVHYTPHDVGVHDYSIGRTRQSFAKDYGLILRRVDRLSRESGIEAVRKLLPYCVFDLEMCDDGLKTLESYRKEWDDKKATYRDTPYHDWASNGADAFRTGAQVHPFTKVMFTQVGGDGGILVPVAGGGMGGGMGIGQAFGPNPKGWT